MRCFLRMSLRLSLYDVLPAVRAVQYAKPRGSRNSNPRSRSAKQRKRSRNPKAREPKRQAMENEPQTQLQGAEARTKRKKSRNSKKKPKLQEANAAGTQSKLLAISKRSYAARYCSILGSMKLNFECINRSTRLNSL